MLTAAPLDLNTTEDTPLTITLAELLAGATDVDTNTSALTVNITQPPASGSLVRDGAGGFVYTPANDTTGAVSFTYTVGDGTSQSATQRTVTIAIGARACRWPPPPRAACRVPPLSMAHARARARRMRPPLPLLTPAPLPAALPQARPTTRPC